MDTPADVSLDTAEIEDLLEPFLSALRRRDGATAEQMVREHFGDAMAIMLDLPLPAEP